MSFNELEKLSKAKIQCYSPQTRNAACYEQKVEIENSIRVITTRIKHGTMLEVDNKSFYKYQCDIYELINNSFELTYSKDFKNEGREIVNKGKYICAARSSEK